MATIHRGTATTLAAIPIASCSNSDVAYIWLNGASVKMVFNSTDTHATDTSDGATTPYYIRPDDYGAGPGVWVEDVGEAAGASGADNSIRLPASRIITGVLLSTNWIDGTSGSKLSLDDGQFVIKDDTFGNSGVQIGWFSGAHKLYVGDGANAFLQFDGTKLTWKAANSQLDASGNLTASSATISGQITATTGAIGGFTIGATSITSTNVGIHSGASAEILLGHATTYADAKIGLKNDGSGKLANGNISWDTDGVLTLTGTWGGSTGITLAVGANLTLSSATGDGDSVAGYLKFNLNSFNIKIGGSYDENALVFSPSSDGVGSVSIGKQWTDYGSDYPFEYVEATAGTLYFHTKKTGSTHVSGYWARTYDNGTTYARASIYAGDSSGETYAYWQINYQSNAYYIDAPRVEYIELDKSYDPWIGFASDEGRLLFNHALGGDYLCFLDCYVGIGTSTPSLNADITLEGGAICLKETTTPSADANYGKLYTKNDNFLYFQDGAGNEHEIAFT